MLEIKPLSPGTSNAVGICRFTGCSALRALAALREALPGSDGSRFNPFSREGAKTRRRKSTHQVQLGSKSSWGLFLAFNQADNFEGWKCEELGAEGAAVA
jgi:hypothetical protein